MRSEEDMAEKEEEYRSNGIETRVVQHTRQSTLAGERERADMESRTSANERPKNKEHVIRGTRLSWGLSDRHFLPTHKGEHK
jgi:hypothetical protein